jgi:hypothetical protein
LTIHFRCSFYISIWWFIHINTFQISFKKITSSDLQISLLSIDWNVSFAVTPGTATCSLAWFAGGVACCNSKWQQCTYSIKRTSMSIAVLAFRVPFAHWAFTTITTHASLLL